MIIVNFTHFKMKLKRTRSGPKWVCIFVNVNSKTWRSSKYILYFMYSIGVKEFETTFDQHFFWGLKFAFYLLEQVLACYKHNVIWIFYFIFQILWHLCLVCSQVQFKTWLSWRFFFLNLFFNFCDLLCLDCNQSTV